MNRLTLTGILASLVALSVPTGSVLAAEYAWARVLEVQPVVRVVRVETPRRECRDVAVRHYGTNTGPTDPAGAAVAGAVIGGIIGNQFGSGSGRRVATATGVVLGSKAFHRRAVRNARPVTRLERRCDTYEEVREVERDGGYRVTYEYAGRAHVTHMNRYPGNRIRIRVSVQPAGFP